MNNMIRCLVLALLASSFSLVAFGVSPQPQDGVKPPPTLVDKKWGNNVVVTCALTEGQSLGDYISTKRTVGAIVGEWIGNLTAVSDAGIPTKAEIMDYLTTLKQTIDKDAEILKWTPRDLIVTKWKNLKGTEANKGTILGCFLGLEGLDMMALPFLHQPTSNEAKKELTEVLKALDKPGHETLLALRTRDLYEKGADDVNLSCDDLTLLSLALDTVKLFRTQLPHGPEAGVKGVGCCSRLTRQCVTPASGNCSLCGSSCCLGSTWCP